MNPRIIILGAVVLVGVTGALSQIRAVPTRPATTHVATTLKYPKFAYRVEIVELTRADQTTIGSSPPAGDPPYSIFVYNIGKRRLQESRMKSLIEACGSEGWELDRVQSMGEGGELEELMLVFKRPAPLPSP